MQGVMQRYSSVANAAWQASAASWLLSEGPEEMLAADFEELVRMIRSAFPKLLQCHPLAVVTTVA